MNRRTFLCGLTLGLLAAPLAAEAQPSAPVGVALRCTSPDVQALVGLWESVATSTGGIGHVLEFRTDGSFIEATTMLVNAAYRLEGDQLFIADSPAEAQATKQGSEIRIEGDTLLQTDVDGTLVRRERLEPRDSAVGSPIVGAWRYRHYTGAMAFERYTVDGRLLFRLPMVSSSGCYLLEGDGIGFVGGNGRKHSVAYTLQGAQVELSAPGKQPVQYRREPAGPWYPRATIDYQEPPKPSR